MDSQPPEIRERFGSRPLFADDDEALPLQASDFLAWIVRRKALTQCGLVKPMRQVPWDTKMPGVQHLEIVVSPEYVQWAHDKLYGRETPS